MFDEKRKLVFGALVALLISIAPVGMVKADSGDVVASFNAPPWGCYDLAWDGSFLWGIEHAEGKITKLDTNGNIITSFNVENVENIEGLGGLAYDGKYLWYAANYRRGEGKIYKVDTNGNIIASFDSPIDDVTGYDGLTYDGKYLWFSSFEERKMLKLDMNGNVIFEAKVDIYPFGLAWDGKYLWVNSNEDRRIYKLDTNGNFITSIDAPKGPEGCHLKGLACDGEHLWLSGELNSGTKIFKIDLGKAAPPSKPTEGVPGFEAILAIVGLLAAACILRRRK